MVPETRPRTVTSRATTLPTMVAPAAIVRSVPRSSPLMLQRISHGPSHTMLPTIGASARNEHAPARAAAPPLAGTSGACAGSLAVALPGIVPPRAAHSLVTASYHVPRIAAAYDFPFRQHDRRRPSPVSR